jgi:hypothetical protein
VWDTDFYDPDEYALVRADGYDMLRGTICQIDSECGVVGFFPCVADTDVTDLIVWGSRSGYLEMKVTGPTTINACPYNGYVLYAQFALRRSSKEESESSANNDVMIGIVLGILIPFMILICACVFWFSRKEKASQTTDYQDNQVGRGDTRISYGNPYVRSPPPYASPASNYASTPSMTAPVNAAQSFPAASVAYSDASTGRRRSHSNPPEQIGQYAVPSAPRIQYSYELPQMNRGLPPSLAVATIASNPNRDYGVPFAGNAVPL